MTLINHPNIGDVQKYAYLIATVTAVDSDNDTVDFAGVGRCPARNNIPLFYHCSNDVAERGNGALEGAAAAFSADDRVIVQCEIISALTYEPVRVIGFEDQPKDCAEPAGTLWGCGLHGSDSDGSRSCRLGLNLPDEAPYYEWIPPEDEDPGYWAPLPLKTFMQVGSDLWQEVAGGENYSLAIKEAGTLWSTGRNNYGQLGLGHNNGKTVFTQVGSDTWLKIAGSRGGSSFAIKSDGTLWSTGHNGYGQLGLGHKNNKNSFNQVGSSTWLEIAAGHNHLLAIKSDGTLWVCGRNDNGQLGLGNSGFGTERTVLTKVGSATWSKVAGGDYTHSLAIKSDNTLWSTGYNSVGQLGLGHNNNRDVFTSVGGSWSQIGGGYVHSLAIDSDGVLKATGRNQEGQLGLGNNDAKDVFTLAESGSWTMVIGSYQHSFAIKSDGTLWSTGDNTGGQLGLGDTNNRNDFTQVGSDEWIKIAELSGYISLAIKAA